MMRNQFDEMLNETLHELGNATILTEEQQNAILENIHTQIEERRFQMKFNKSKKILIAAAAIMVLGTVTVIGAGKISGYRSGVNVEEIDFTNASELSKAEDLMGAAPKAPQEFKNGIKFKAGYMVDVEVYDEAGITIGTYPQVSIDYSNLLFLSIEKPLDEEELNHPLIKSETYQSVELCGYEDAYLFLPPDVEPGEADLKREAEGRLYISYGSSEEERKTFRYIQWKEEGLTYLLSTFSEDYSMDELMIMAKEVVDVK